MVHRLFVPLGLASVLMVVSSGCGPKNPLGRMAISGKITLDGTALDTGSIQFSPLQEQGGFSSGTVITNGSYEIAAHQGLPPGEYLVRIFSAEKGAAPPPDEPPGPDVPPPGKERIPPEYNARSNIKIQVTEDGPNTFDFNIQTK